MTKTTSNTPKVSITSVSARIHREVDQLLLEKNLAVFQVVYQTDLEEPAPANMAARLQLGRQEGFARPSAIQRFLSDKAAHISTVENLVLVPDGFLEHARLHGYVDACEKFQQHFAGSAEGAYEQFLSGKASVENLVILEHSSHMLFDRNGEVLPTALFFDYMNGNLRNGSYDLKKAMEILRKDPRVTPVTERRSYRGDSAEEGTWRVQEVPYYNVSKGCSQHLSFVFAPTAEDMTSLWAQMKSYKTQYPSTERHRAIFDLDMLGLRAGGAAKYKSYHEDDAYASSDDDNDD